MSDAVHTTYAQRFNASYGEAFKGLARRYSLSSKKPDSLSDKGQSYEQKSRLYEQIIPYVKKHPVRAAVLGTTSALAIATSVYALGPVITAAQAVGLVGFALARESATFKHHTQVLAVASMSCLFSMAQQAMMAATSGDIGSYIPGGIMLAHAALTMGIFSIMPQPKNPKDFPSEQHAKIKEENKPVLRLRGIFTGVSGIVGAGAVLWASNKYHNVTGLIPAITTLGNAALFAIPDIATARARLGYIGMNLLHTFLWATQPVQSAALLLTEVMYAATHATTLAEHDVPVADRKTGRSFTTRERMSAYWNNIIRRREEPTNIGVTRHEQGWERPDNKVYARIGRLILGSQPKQPIVN